MSLQHALEKIDKRLGQFIYRDELKEILLAMKDEDKEKRIKCLAQTILYFGDKTKNIERRLGQFEELFNDHCIHTTGEPACHHKETSNDEGKNELLSTKIECRKLSDIQNIFDIQVNDPSSKTDSYMRGMANGMIMLKSILDGCEAKFIDKPSPEKQAEPQASCPHCTQIILESDMAEGGCSFCGTSFSVKQPAEQAEPYSLCNYCQNECKATHPRKECTLFTNKACERDRLIKQLRNMIKHCKCVECDKSFDGLATFILADRRRVLEDIEKPLKDFKKSQGDDWRPTTMISHCQIDEALSKIQEHKWMEK